MAIAIPNLSPADLLGRFRGTILHAAPGYPEVIHLTLKDAQGDLWHFSTWYAEFSPSDPEFFPGKKVVDVTFDSFGRLTMWFADGSQFDVLPEPEGQDDELSTWDLSTPNGLFLRFRPRGLWDLGLGSEVV